jgi:hypothetical protein
LQLIINSETDLRKSGWNSEDGGQFGGESLGRRVSIRRRWRDPQARSRCKADSHSAGSKTALNAGVRVLAASTVVAWIAAGSIVILNFKWLFGTIRKTIAGIVDGEFGPRSNIARSLC